MTDSVEEEVQLPKPPKGYNSKCMVLNCTSPKTVPSFRLPQDPERRAAYLKFADNPNLRRRLPAKTRMCMIHFEPKYVLKSDKRFQLTKTAVPTLNKPASVPLNCLSTNPSTSDPDPSSSCDPSTDPSKTHFKTREKKLYNTLISSKLKIKRLQSHLANNEEKLWNLSKNKKNYFTVNKLTRDLPRALRLLIESGDRKCKRKKKGKIWNLDEKLFCISVFNKSQITYRYLRTLMPLPCCKTLNSLLNEIPFEAGLIDTVFTNLKDKVKLISHIFSTHKICALLFDEMTLTPSLQYNKNKDQVEGFENYGFFGKTNLVANRVLVFMIRSLGTNWKMPIAYYFFKDTVPKDVLARLIEYIIIKIQSIGLKPAATICVQTNRNVEALNLLGHADSLLKRPYFFSYSTKIFTFFDPPHLLKNIRNNLMTCNIETDDGLVEWSHIEKMFELNQSVLPVAWKLTPKHLKLNGKSKLNVTLAAQLLSFSAMFSILYFVKGGEMSEEYLATAKFIQKIDQLFDSFNSSKDPDKQGKKHIRLLSKNSIHWTFWKEITQEIKRWKFIDKNNKAFRLACQDGWLHNIKAIQLMWNNIKCNFKRFDMRLLNLDPLENLFSLIKQHSGFNSNPTITQFESALKTIIINNICSNELAPSNNCRDDNNEFLTDLRNVIESVNSNQTNLPVEININFPTKLIESVIRDLEHDKLLESKLIKNDSPYVAGYIIKKIVDQGHNCSSCLSCCKRSETFPVIEMIEFSSQRRSFVNRSENLIRFVENCTNLIVQKLEKLNAGNLRKNLIESCFKNIDDSWFVCEIHKENFIGTILNILSIILIYRKCKILNHYISKRYKNCKNYRKNSNFAS